MRRAPPPTVPYRTVSKKEGVGLHQPQPRPPPPVVVLVLLLLLLLAAGEPLGASGEPAGSENLQELLHQCVSPSQTLQNSQTPLEGDTNPPVHKKEKKQHRRNPYRYLTSLLHRRRSDEDQTGILAGTDCEGPNYGTLP
ncbi:hypothetical protein CRUP_001881 [Coryphaenoides rupestris]|nr:hypothetical protein CRUP_001881 [Coryphaenoides rupestris]